MPNINDTYASVLSGYSGSVNDRRSELLTGILAYAKPLSLNDMEVAALASLGYTGALNDAWDKYIKALGGFGISAKADYLSSTFYGNPVPFLFASAQPGVWYDPSDLTTMFQDNLGSTPVTAPGQTVGLLLDKSKNGVGTNGSSRRNLLVATATLSTQSVTVTAVAHTLSFTGTGTVTLTGASIAGPLIGTGASNRVSLTFTPTAGSLILTVLGSVTLAQLEIGSTATAYQPITTSWSATLAGNHATQATSTQRPIYGINPITGTRNTLTYTEQFENSAWSKQRSSITANAIVSPDGQTTADKLIEDTTASNTHHMATQFAKTVAVGPTSFSVYLKAAERTRAQVGLSDNATGGLFIDINLATGSFTTSKSGTWTSFVAAVDSLGNGWYRCAVSGTQATGFALPLVYIANDAGATSYTGNGTSGIYVWGAQLERSSAATPYQKVVTQYEVTQTGVQSASYLAFDGVDDGMVTGTITPATDKAQVFTGARKLSDSASGMLVELGDGTSQPGIFGFRFPSLALSGATFSSRGTSSANATAGGIPAPSTNVLTGLGDIVAPSSILRSNGIQLVTDTTSQGTGNFLAYPIYIGRRAGTSNPFNGRIYSLIVRFGSNLTTGQITSTEKWVNSKTGAF